MDKASLMNGKTSLEGKGRAGGNTRPVAEEPDRGCSLRTDQANLREMVRLFILLLTLTRRIVSSKLTVFA